MPRRTHHFGFGDFEVFIDKVAMILIKVAFVVSLALMLIKHIGDQIASWWLW